MLKLSVEPLRTYLSLKVGDTWKSTLQVTNTNKKPLSYQLKVVGMRDDGTLIGFSPATTTAPTPNRSFERWLTVDPTEFTLTRGEKKTITVQIRVPSTAEPGEYRALVLLGTERGEIPGNVAEVQSYVSSAFRLTVEGVIIERGEIRELSVTNHWLVTQYPEVTVRFSNTGNTELRPKGQMSFTKETFNKTDIRLEKDIEFQPLSPNKTVLLKIEPGQENRFGFGHYTASIRLSYGTDQPQSAVSDVDFWVVPPIVLFIGIIASVLFLGFVSFILSVKYYAKKKRCMI